MVAFEPNPEAVEQIRERLPQCPWLSLENVALGSKDEEFELIVEPGDTSAICVLIRKPDTPGNSISLFR